jgi:hypothetical protein
MCPESIPQRSWRDSKSGGCGLWNQAGVIAYLKNGGPLETGDLLFVAAGTEHRFEDISDDTAYWLIFYGPAGGEIGP